LSVRPTLCLSILSSSYNDEFYSELELDNSPSLVTLSLLLLELVGPLFRGTCFLNLLFTKLGDFIFTLLGDLIEL